MNKLLTKVAPLAAMTACAIWCCWLQLREATPLLAATEASLPRIERKLLHPEITAVSERDPFLQYKPEPPPSQPIEAAAIVPEKPRFNPATAIAAIRLDATMLGATRLAVINGKVHTAGAVIVLDELPDVQCQLLNILANEIVVKIEQQTYRIDYSRKAEAARDPAPTGETVSETPPDLGGDLPAGTPLPDDLDRAVADSLAHQASSTSDRQFLIAEETDDATTEDHEDEACEYEQDLLITEKLNKLLNNNE